MTLVFALLGIALNCLFIGFWIKWIREHLGIQVLIRFVILGVVLATVYAYIGITADEPSHYGLYDYLGALFSILFLFGAIFPLGIIGYSGIFIFWYLILKVLRREPGFNVKEKIVIGLKGFVGLIALVGVLGVTSLTESFCCLDVQNMDLPKPY